MIQTLNVDDFFVLFCHGMLTIASAVNVVKQLQVYHMA